MFPALLDKAENPDHDIRFMAMSDMKNALAEDYRLDERMEARVAKVMTKLLNDKNAEVQNMAVTCLPLLIQKINPRHITDLVKPLSDSLLNGDERQRDVASIAIKSVIANLGDDSSMAVSLFSSLLDQILTSMNKGDAADAVLLEMLDVLHDILLRFGKILQTQHAPIQSSLLVHLSHARMAVRKRAVTALGGLVAITSEELFTNLMKYVTENLNAAMSESDPKTRMQLVITISREAGGRFSPFLNDVLPQVIEVMESEDDDDLRDLCIQAFNSFALRCQKDVAEHMQQLCDICLRYLQHDPNYNYDSDDDEDMNSDDSDFDGSDDDGDYSDDDDVSWKVRRSAAVFFSTIIKTRPLLLGTLLEVVCPVLVKQFREREEGVRTEVYQTYRALLQQIRTITPKGACIEPSILALINQSVPHVVKILVKQATKEKSLKIRLGLLGVFRDIASTAHGSLVDFFPSIVPAVEKLLSDKESSPNVKIDCLIFYQKLMDTHPSEAFISLIPSLANAVVGAIDNTFYKITAEALATANKMFAVMRPQTDQPLTADLPGSARTLYNAVLTKFKATDIDQEVKEQSIRCIAQVLYTVSDELEGVSTTCLPILLARLQNESTRIVATNAIAHVASSPLHVDLKIILKDTYAELATFLRKDSRSLRVSALVALEILVSTYDDVMHSQLCGLLENMGGVDNENQQKKRRRVQSPEVTDLEIESFSVILAETPTLIDTNDLACAQYTMSLVTSVIKIHSPLAAKLESEIPVLPALIDLSTSPILQGSVLDALCECLKTLAGASISSLSVENLLQHLLKPIYTPATKNSGLALPRQAFGGVSKCAATLAVLNTSGVLPLVSKFISDICTESISESVKLLSLLTVGEIGKDIDLSGAGDILGAISNSFSSQSEHIKTAAAFALGNISAGNLGLFLPKLLAEIRVHPPHLYLLLQSLKELISCKARSVSGIQTLADYVGDIWTLLQEYSDGQDEGMRGVVSECLGKIVVVDAAKYLSLLQENLASDSAGVRSTMIQAFKFTVSDQHSVSDEHLQNVLPHFLTFISDPDLVVRRISLVTFNSAVHNKANLVKTHLVNILPMVYKETEIRKDLIRVVEVGPFKQNFDDGLDARKSAFEACLTLLENCTDVLDIPEFVVQVSKGLADQHDIQILTHLMLLRLAVKFPSALSIAVPTICEHITKILAQKPKSKDVKVTIEKIEERKKAALKTVRAITKCPGSESISQLEVLMQKINGDASLAAMYAATEKDQVQ